VRDWFATTLGEPTAVQAAAWPLIARGEHVLVTAPTGSGKTLTAFLWALDGFAAGSAQPGRTRALYVSPLKALNNDIRQNLLEPLAALQARGALPPLRAETRSGDTPQAERQRLLRRPPEILITTPESLLLMLSTVRGRLALGDVETVIVDEVHALVDDRRGTLLLVALERLARLAGEFQRIALSATVRPLDAVAAFVAGTGPGGRPRDMTTVAAAQDKQIELDVRFPDAAVGVAERGQKIWDPLSAAFRQHIQHNRSTLLFVNSRRLAERLTFKINEGADAPLAWAHHGSLARELRLAVEQRLKSGALRAIVATSSLELGIDVGSLDEVLLVQSPPDIAAALQRIGRAGHAVGAVSRASLYPTHAADFIEAAALARAVAERDIEPAHLLENPLDVLAQLIVAITASESWDVDALFDLFRQSGPYRRLQRQQFDLVIDMLAGRFAGNRIRELRPRLRVDRIRRRVEAERSAVMAFHHSGGVIPDRGYFQLRHADTGAAVGELDEEFVWEATTGQVFTFGTQNWQIQRITHNDVLARPTTRPATAPPFWRSESLSRSFHYSARIGAFLESAEQTLAARDRAGLLARLTDEDRFDPIAAQTLVEHLERQRAATGAPLPHARHLLAETVRAAPGGYRSPGDLEQLILHTFWGGRVNRPLALALRAALQGDPDMLAGERVEITATDDAIVLLSRAALEPRHVLALVTPDNLLSLLRGSLESSGFFGARFREAAGRALLLTRQRFNQRLPLWISRLQARKLLSSVHELVDFPLLIECWRACLEDEFDLPALTRCLDDLAAGRIAVSTVRTATPSPFAGELAWTQINRYMYADDQPERSAPTALADDLIDAAIDHAVLRPRLRPETVADFVARRQRTAAGYAPENEDDWADWIRERILLPEAELPAPVAHPDLALVELEGRRWWAHRELLHGLVASGLCAGARFEGAAPPLEDPRSAEQFALEILSFYGPLTEREIAERLPRVPPELLDDADDLVRGTLLAGDVEQIRYCDRQNFEAMLRLQRARARPALEPLPGEQLPTFLARWQGLGAGGDPDALADHLSRLSGYRAPLAVWLHELPAARAGWAPDAPAPADLDAALGAIGFAWQGAGNGQVRLGDPEDLELLDAPRPPAAIAGLFADPAAGYAFTHLLDRQDEGLEAFNAAWWQDVWSGGLVADTLQPLRDALAREFRLTGTGRPTRQRPGARLRAPRLRHAGPTGWPGYWRLLPPPAPDDDPLAELEAARERARLLLDRYGVVCREIANREGDRLRWSAVFRALRLMELAGEVLAGYYFTGLSGPQFATPAAVALLQDARTAAPPAFWVNAMDPVAPCGLGLDWPALPQRRPQNYLAFRDGSLALVIENQGRRLRFMTRPQPEVLGALLTPLAHLLAREGRIAIESIDDAPAAASPLLDALAAIGRVTRDHRQVWLERS
jgi:ATP-dependent Lhr-like helicase